MTKCWLLVTERWKESAKLNGIYIWILCLSSMYSWTSVSMGNWFLDPRQMQKSVDKYICEWAQNSSRHSEALRGIYLDKMPWQFYLGLFHTGYINQALTVSDCY